MQINGLNRLTTDVLIIGGGTAGCYAALTIREKSDASIIIAEKANIKRSGCLAAGVNAINAYIVEGRKPEDYVEYAKKDADDIVREDLLLTMSERLNEVTAKMEKLGLVILKDENGRYVARGNRNIKINGENIKPILADAVNSLENVIVINRLNITDYIVKDNTILGAVGFNIDTGEAYEIRAKKVLCATGGAAGLYKPNNPGFSRHKMWYPPFNTGAGFAMGINAGAEMTTFEMRFIALRCKDTIAPTGTIAQGVGAKQVNSLGEVYENRYGLTTSQRVYGTVRENIEGRGPCYLTEHQLAKKKMIYCFWGLFLVLALIYMWRDRCRKNKYIALQKQLNENRAEIMMLSESSAPIEEKSAELHDLKEKNLQICISLFEATEGYKKLNELKNMKPGKRILKIQDYRERIIGDIRESFLDVMNNLRENCRSLTNEDLFYCLLSLLHCPKDLLLGIMDASSDAIKARKHRIKDKMDTVLFDKVFGSDNQKLM